MTDTKKIDFKHTDEALADLNAAILHLSEVANAKKKALENEKSSFEAELNNKDSKINLLSQSCTNVIDNIDNIINQLNKVLENDGSSYNNN